MRTAETVHLTYRATTQLEAEPTHIVQVFASFESNTEKTNQADDSKGIVRLSLQNGPNVRTTDIERVRCDTASN